MVALPPLRAGAARGLRTSLEEIEGDPRVVSVQMTVYRVNGVDPVAGSFQAEINVHMWWYEAHLRGEAIDGKVRQIDVSMASVPVISFENGLDIQPVRDPILELRRKFPPGVVHYEWRVRGVFSEDFELGYFPFDVQALTVHLRVNSKADQEMGRFFAFDTSFTHPVNIKPAVRLAEWFMYPAAVECAPDKTGKPEFKAHLILRRRPEFFIYNVILIQGITCSLAFTTFAIPKGDLADRASVALTLLLTTVALKFAMADSLPKVPYATVLDWYMNGGFLILAGILVENAVVAAAGVDSVKYLDAYLALTLAAAWVGFHVVYFWAVDAYLRAVTDDTGPPMNELSGSRAADFQNTDNIKYGDTAAVSAQAVKLNLLRTSWGQKIQTTTTTTIRPSLSAHKVQPRGLAKVADAG